MSDVRNEDPALLEAEADRAALGGEHEKARRLLQRASALKPDSADIWLKLAALCRAGRDLPAALEAISGALRVDPLGFVPLLMKASLLEAMGQVAAAGEAYGHALAQAPDEVPPPFQAPLRRAEQVYARYQQGLAESLVRVAVAAEGDLAENERGRIRRFTTNIARLTRPFHCEPTHFHYPGLAEREYHDRDLFPFLTRLEGATPVIRAEFERVMAEERAELVPYIQYPEDQPLRQWKGLNWNRDWTAIHLLLNGERVEANARHCPETMRILGELDQPQIAGRSPNAMFSLLAPGTRIPPHHGVANTRLVCHLPLIVPPNCWFRVGAETRYWKEGEAWVFDDTIEHEAANDSDQLRVLLIIDLWHPGLGENERRAVAAIMGASPDLGESGL